MSQFFGFFRNLFNYTDFVPLGENGYWTSFHQAFYILSDLIAGSAYFVLPAVVVMHLRKLGRKVRFNSLYFLFAAFILLNGSIYFSDALMFGLPVFRFGALLRFLSAIASWIAIYYVIRILPIAFSLKSPVELDHEVDRRKKVELEVRKKNEQLLEAERTAKLGYGVMDISRKEVQISDMAYHLLDIPVGTKISFEQLTEQIHPADLRFVEDTFRKNLQEKYFKDFYFRIVTDRMVVKHILVRGEVIRNASGEPLFFKGTMQDVSELRIHMQRIEQQNARLKKIAWVQSHRMRSPVASILGMVELFNEDDPSDPMNVEVINNIKELSQKLDEIIREVDELTREK